MWTANVGLWGTKWQSDRTWIIDTDGKPLCMCDESGERSISRLAAKGLTVLPQAGQTVESLLAQRYLEP